MFMIATAPPNRAAAPTAPVFIGMATPFELELLPEPEPEPAPAAPVAVAALGVAMADVGAGMPLVNGTTEAELAPENATD